jgi:hypothetical protein
MIGGTGTDWVTVSVPVPAVPLAWVARIAAVPSATASTRPREPAAFETAATAGFDDDHVTPSVRSRIVRSENVPVAVYDCALPTAIAFTAGATATPTRTAGTGSGTGTSVTASIAAPKTPSAGSIAVIVTEPARWPFARPFVPAEFETLATLGSDDDQFTLAEMSRVVRSEYVPVAMNCCA